MTPAFEWAKEPRSNGRRLVVASKTGSVHALSVRKRFGRQITLCGRALEPGWEDPRPLRDSEIGARLLSCGQCKAILEEPESFRGRPA